MPDFSGYYPYLFAGDWPARPHCLCRPIDSRIDVVVGYGKIGEERIHFLMAKEAAENGYTIADVEAVALPNLQNREDSPEWTMDQVDWAGALRPLYSREGDDRTASDLLNPDSLRKVQEELGCDEIKVAIPQSCCILACAPDMAWGLAGLAKARFDQAVEQGAEPLTPYLLTVSDGQITGFDKTDWDPDARPY